MFVWLFVVFVQLSVVRAKSSLVIITGIELEEATWVDESTSLQFARVLDRELVMLYISNSLEFLITVLDINLFLYLSLHTI